MNPLNSKQKKRSRSENSSSSSTASNTQNGTPLRKNAKTIPQTNFYETLEVNELDTSDTESEQTPDTPKITTKFDPIFKPDIKTPDQSKAQDQEPTWVDILKSDMKKYMDELSENFERSVIAKLDQKIDDILESNSNLEAELKEANNTIKAAQSKIIELDENLNKQHRQIALQEKKLQEAESYSKKYNLKLYGMEESNGETQIDIIHNLGMIIDKMGLDKQKVSIDNIHRLPAGGKGPRPIIIRFVTMLARNYIWENRTHLRGSPYTLREHYSKTIEDNIKILLPIRRAAIDMGMRVQLTADQLRINGQLYTTNNLNTLPSSLDPQKLSTHTEKNHLFFFSQSCPLSNLHPSHFKVDNIPYTCNEEFIHCSKAKLFQDPIAFNKIQHAHNPGQIKFLASKIQNFDKQVWDRNIQEIATRGNRAKFTQNTKLMKFLVSTNTQTLIESNPRDSIWGIGMSMKDPNLMKNKKNWGKNLQGNILMSLRTEFQSSR